MPTEFLITMVFKNLQSSNVQALDNAEYITDKDYSKLTQRAKATRALDFQKMRALGYLIKAGAGPATYYKLKK